MNNLWTEYRSAPTSYLQSVRMSTEALMASMIQVLASDQERRDQNKLTVLGVWQEMCHTLFNDPERLIEAIQFLKSLLSQPKPNSLFLSQVLCTITTLLIEMELILPSHDKELTDFICILFDYIEKMKTESNRLLKSVACDCLRELEMTYPGLLVQKVGHFFGMSVAENSYIHQHYMALFATVLDHAVQKFLYEDAQEGISSPPPSDALTDLLSYGEPLKSFEVAASYKETADAILGKKVPRSNITDIARFNEVRKGLSFILDCSHLFTPSCLVSTYLRLISCIHFTSLSPKILKRLFQHAPCQDIRLFQLMFLMKLKFGPEICGEVDEANLKIRLLTLAGQTTLPGHHRALVWEWFLRWPEDSMAVDSKQVEEDEDNPVKQSLEYEVELRHKILQPSIFDSHVLFYSKCKALCRYESSVPLSDQSYGPSSISDMVVNLLTPVKYGSMGPLVVTLYRVLYSQYILRYQYQTTQDKEIEKLVLELVLRHPRLIPNTIDFLSSVQSAKPESHLPLNVMSEVVKFLVSSPLSELLVHIKLRLMFIKHALSHPLLNPVVMLQLLAKVLSESSLCAKGSWDLGNTLIEICTTTMRIHPTETVLKDLSDLLQLMAENYSDIDIQDRARFYHHLMLTVSGDKLSAILTLASDSTTGSSLSDIVEARISNSVFPSTPPIRHVSGGSTFISLERVSYVNEEEYYKDIPDPDNKETSESREAMLITYLQSLENNCGQNPIHLHYKINFLKKPQGVSNTIYALVLKLSSSKYYNESPDVHVPFLSLDGNGVASKLITITLYPKEPVPVEFNLSAAFNDEDGVTYSTLLAPVRVHFTDLFLPLPAQFQDKGSGECLYSILWDYIESMQQNSGSIGHGVLSTMNLDLQLKDLSKEFGAFEVTPVISEEEELQQAIHEIHRVVIFLPPCYHLLLRFNVGPSSTNVAIATDNWRLLPLVNHLLQTYC